MLDTAGGSFHCSHCHESPVTSSYYTDFGAVYIIKALQPFLSPDTVFEVLVAMILVVHLKEAFSIAAAAPVVYCKHGISMIYKVLCTRAEPNP